MKNCRSISLNVVFTLMLFLSCLQAHAQVPEVISYQGVLTDTNGAPLSGDYDITARLYAADLGGVQLWEETHYQVAVSNGVFNLKLGSVNAFSPELDFSTAYWLGIAINDESELEPRLEFASVATALMSKTVMDGSVTSAKIADGAVVRSVNGLKDDVTVSAGSNVTVTNSGSDISISAAAIACNWSGWAPAFDGVRGDVCTQSVPGIDIYCSGGVVTSMRTSSVCAKAYDNSP